MEWYGRCIPVSVTQCSNGSSDYYYSIRYVTTSSNTIRTLLVFSTTVQIKKSRVTLHNKPYTPETAPTRGATLSLAGSPDLAWTRSSLNICLLVLSASNTNPSQGWRYSTGCYYVGRLTACSPRCDVTQRQSQPFSCHPKDKPVVYKHRP